MVTALSLLFVAQTAPLAPAVVSKTLQSKVDEIYARTGAPGVSAAVVLPNGEVITACAGYSDPVTKMAMTADNVFCAGSTGKMLVGAALALLVSEGRLNLDEPVAKDTDIAKMLERVPNCGSLTLRHLLNHTSGLSDHVYNKGFLARLKAEPDRQWTAAELASYLSDTKSLFEAGKGWAYSDTNYVIAGAVLESVAGKGLFEFAEERVLKPGEVSEVWPALSRTHKNLCNGTNMPDSPLGLSGYTLTEGKLPFNPQMEHGGGGTFTTPRGLAQWAKALYEGKAVSQKAVDLIIDGVPAKLGRDQKYGIGCMIRPTIAGLSYGHSGWFPGYLSDVMYLTEHRVSVAVQVNSDDFRKMKGSGETFNREIVSALFEKS